MFRKYALIALMVTIYVLYLWGVFVSKHKVDVLLLGDSITRHMPSGVLTDQVVNIGVSGFDTVELYDNLNLSGTNRFFHWSRYDPELVVLAIGVNNWLRVVLDDVDDGYFSDAYIKSRQYSGITEGEIGMDVSFGVVNFKGVKQIIAKIKEGYGEDQKIILVGVFPSEYDFDVGIFEGNLKGIAENNNGIEFVSVHALSNIGWSDTDQKFYDYDIGDSEGFASTHIDYVHLNERGYMVYAVILQCAIDKILRHDIPLQEHCLGDMDAASVNAALVIE